MKCKQAQNILGEHLDGRLPAPEADLLERHIASCRDCRTEWESVRRTVQLVRDLPQMSAPADLASSIRDAISKESLRKPAPVHRWAFAANVAALAACALLILSFALQLLPTQKRTAIRDQEEYEHDAPTDGPGHAAGETGAQTPGAEGTDEAVIYDEVTEAETRRRSHSNTPPTEPQVGKGSPTGSLADAEMTAPAAIVFEVASLEKAALELRTLAAELDIRIETAPSEDLIAAAAMDLTFVVSARESARRGLLRAMTKVAGVSLSRSRRARSEGEGEALMELGAAPTDQTDTSPDTPVLFSIVLRQSPAPAVAPAQQR